MILTTTCGSPTYLETIGTKGPHSMGAGTIGTFGNLWELSGTKWYTEPALLNDSHYYYCMILTTPCGSPTYLGTIGTKGPHSLGPGSLGMFGNV